jgi:hypothetical protein
LGIYYHCFQLRFVVAGRNLILQRVQISTSSYLIWIVQREITLNNIIKTMIWEILCLKLKVWIYNVALITRFQYCFSRCYFVAHSMFLFAYLS